MAHAGCHTNRSNIDFPTQADFYRWSKSVPAVIIVVFRSTVCPTNIVSLVQSDEISGEFPIILIHSGIPPLRKIKLKVASADPRELIMWQYTDNIALTRSRRSAEVNKCTVSSWAQRERSVERGCQIAFTFTRDFHIREYCLCSHIFLEKKWLLM